jgi:hypothetical protein
MQVHISRFALKPMSAAERRCGIGGQCAHWLVMNPRRSGR